MTNALVDTTFSSFESGSAHQREHLRLTFLRPFPPNQQLYLHMTIDSLRSDCFRLRQRYADMWNTRCHAEPSSIYYHQYF